jgi:UDP-N-acetylmuramate dehydrogenase
MRILENVPLAPLTTLQVGGPARYFAEATSFSEIHEAVAVASEQRLPLFVMGGGSNLVISDDGWPGMVLKVAIRGRDERTVQGSVLIDVGAGEDWDEVVSYAVTHNYAGVECLSGIPGSVGGTPVQNVGAYGQEVADTIASVLVFDLRDNQVRELCAEACGLAYRTSIFNSSERGRFIILRVTYSLIPDGDPRIEYADLKRYFAERAAVPTLAETRKAVLQVRASKAMLLVAGDEDSRSAGSFFKNPIVSFDQYMELTRKAAHRDLQIPSYPALEAQRKISAAWLVEHSDFSKGYTLGRAGISRRHALAIVNRGGATAADIVALKDQIQGRVLDAWGLLLDPEPVFVGF